MIINTSRAQQFQACREKAWNWDELHLMSYREADPLIVGEGYHLGSEIISKTANAVEAMDAAEAKMRERYSHQVMLPEELPDMERNITFVRNATAAWAEHYNQADFRVLWPEVAGCVPLPNTEHHCWFAHRILYPDTPYNKCGAHFNKVGDTDTLKCWQPHYFKFRTDGIIEMGKKIWLLEQKTTSSTERNHFMTKWMMEFQTLGYCYGVWKTTGVLVTGFLLNAIIKHSKQVSVDGKRKYQLDPHNVDFVREPYLITKDQLLMWEHDMSGIANEYEEAFCSKAHNDASLKVYKNTSNCFNYNRACYYWDKCLRGGAELDGEFRQRNPDYVELSYYDVLGLPIPDVKETTNDRTENNINAATEV